MSSRRRKEPAEEPGRDDAFTSEDDLSFLKQICDSVEFDEISFDNWCLQHTSLDLQVDLILSGDEARQGVKKSVQWTRTTWRQHPVKGWQPTREKLVEEITVPPKAQNGFMMVIKGMGDSQNGACGDLKVIIRLI